MYTCVYTDVCIYTVIRLFPIYIYIYMHIAAIRPVYVCIHTYTFAYVYIYIYICMHIHMCGPRAVFDHKSPLSIASPQSHWVKGTSPRTRKIIYMLYIMCTCYIAYSLFAPLNLYTLYNIHICTTDAISQIYIYIYIYIHTLCGYIRLRVNVYMYMQMLTPPRTYTNITIQLYSYI